MIHTIETDRLVLRPFQPADFTNYVEQHHSRLPSQHPYDEGRVDLSTFTQEFFNHKIDKYNTMAADDTIYVWGIFRKSDGRHLGHVDLLILMRSDTQWALIGYEIHNQFWKHGYGKESVKAIIDLSFEKMKLHRIEAQINLDNHTSVRLAESVGMSYECTRKGLIHENGEWTDHLIYYINACN